jgi:predicted GIY-YIG superfamily endonuclease
VKAGSHFRLLSERSKGYGLASQQMTNFFYVYVLVSKRDASVHYTGVARDLKKRLAEHNRGKCAYTESNRPWQVETAVAFKSEVKACKFEKYLKSGSGREFARRHF